MLRQKKGKLLSGKTFSYIQKILRILPSCSYYNVLSIKNYHCDVNLKHLGDFCKYQQQKKLGNTISFIHVDFDYSKWMNDSMNSKD